MQFTPGHFSRRADFYHQLGQLTAAGLGVTGALKQLHRAPASRADRAPIAAVLADVAAGFTLSESFARRADWLPAFDLALLHAAERSGRLDAVFQLLASYYQERAAMARRMLGDLAYPIFLLHAAVFLLPIPELVGAGGLSVYLFKVLVILIPVYALALLVLFAAQGRRGATWRAGLERALHFVPLVGSGRHQLALARCSAALEALISSGVGIIEAWPLAAAASGSPALIREVATWQAPLAAGRTPAELLRDSTVFPEMFANLYHSGEISGTLDVTLHRLQNYYTEEGTRALRSAAQWFPRLLYLFIAGYIAWRVIQFWSGYFNQISQVMDG